MDKKRKPKCLVIDADIARAAGKESTRDERSRNCRVFLQTMLFDTPHKVILTRDIRAEWNEHQSLMTLNWRSSMVAQKRICPINASLDDQLRSIMEKAYQNECKVARGHIKKIESMREQETDQNKREILLKDINRIEGKLAEKQNRHEAMLKDIHLIEAALKSDKIVISMDETVRDCFHEIIQNIGTLKQIAWVNPCKDEETPIEWLKSGAALDRERLLGYRREDNSV